MVNQQLQKLINTLEQLVNDNSDLLDKEQITNGLAQVTGLLTTVQQQTAEIEANKQLISAYQFQTQGLQTRLIKNKPRRLSLDNGESSFVSISPRRGSSRSDYEVPCSPFLSPRTPHSVLSTSPVLSIPELDTISSLVEQRENELTENATEVISELQTSEEKLTRQVISLTNQLSAKEDYINALEANQEKQKQSIVELKEIRKKVESENLNWQTNFTKQQEFINGLEAELRETNNDFLITSQKNDDLNQSLLATHQVQAELEQRLEHEINERCRLKDNQEQTYSSLLVKYQEINQAKQSIEKEKEELANFIQQQQATYEQERQQREEQFKKQLDNLRTFQVMGEPRTRSNSLKRPTHSHSFSIGSVPTSRCNSPFNEDFSRRPQSLDLLTELKRQGFQEQGGIIATSPTKTENKRQSTSSLLNWPTEEIQATEINIENILSDITNELGMETICNDLEHGQLQEAMKDLEVQTQKINEELLSHEAEKKEWTNELGQVKYELKESQAQQSRIEQELKVAQTRGVELEQDLAIRASELAQKGELLIINEDLRDEFR